MNPNKIYYSITKDISDYKKATGEEPTKILMKEDTLQSLRDYFEAVTGYAGESSTDKIHGIAIKKTDNINKDWILI